MRQIFSNHHSSGRRPARFFWVRFVLILLLVGFACQWADACPGCKDALAENDPQHARMVRGYFWSILFMMGMPFALAGTFGTFCYLEIRRKRLEDKSEDPPGRSC